MPSLRNALQMKSDFFHLFYLFLRFCFVRLFSLANCLSVCSELVIYSCLRWCALFCLLFRIVVISNQEPGERNRDAHFAYFSFYQSTRMHSSVRMYMAAVAARPNRIFNVSNKSRFVWRIKYLSHQ